MPINNKILSGLTIQFNSIGLKFGSTVNELRTLICGYALFLHRHFCFQFSTNYSVRSIGFCCARNSINNLSFPQLNLQLYFSLDFLYTVLNAKHF